jgi:hypothetical protein
MLFSPPPAPPPIIKTSNKPAFVTVSVEEDVKVSSVYATPLTVILLDVPPVAVPYTSAYTLCVVSDDTYPS